MRRILAQFFVALLMLTAVGVISGQQAHAALYSYEYIGTEDPDCSVQVLGGTATCRVEGSFDLQSAYFGTPQFGLNANFMLYVNNALFDTFFFPAFAFGGIDYCVEYCNEVSTDAAGHITAIEFTIFPPSAIDRAIFLTADSWSWDSFEQGNSLFSNASGATIIELGPKPVPLPSSLGLMLAGLAVVGMKRRRRWR